MPANTPESDRTRAQTRINIGRPYTRWCELKEATGCKTDGDPTGCSLTHYWFPIYNHKVAKREGRRENAPWREQPADNEAGLTLADKLLIGCRLEAGRGMEIHGDDWLDQSMRGLDVLTACTTLNRSPHNKSQHNIRSSADPILIHLQAASSPYWTKSEALEVITKMTLWYELQQLDSRYLDQIGQLYADNFPMEIRQYLSQWIESIDWDAVALDESLARLRFHDLLSKLDELYSRLNPSINFLLHHNIRKIQRNLQEHFQENPMYMAMIISKTLKAERRILEMATRTQENTGSPQGNVVMEKQKQLDSQVNELKTNVQEAEQDIQVLEELQDEHEFKRKTLQSKMEVDMNIEMAKEIQMEELKIREMYLELNKMRETVVMELLNALKLADLIQSTLITEKLPEWKHRQQIACIGGPPNVCLDQLQNWFTTVAECLQKIRHQMNTLNELVQNFSYENDPIALNMSSLQEQALSLFRNLLINSIVVERQPCMPTHPQRPLVLKTSVQFTVKLRLLVKLAELNCQLKVKASFDKDITEKNTVKGFRRFNIFGTNSKVMNMEESNGCLSAEFRHLQLKDQKHPGSRTNESSHVITEELHSISFDTQLKQADFAIDITITSLPVVVISHNNQIPSAWAAIFWFNMLSTDYQNLGFFLNPPPMMWGDLEKVLSWQFSSVTKRGLNTDQLSMLADKLLGPEAGGEPNTPVYWSKFIKTSSNERGVAFWLWIDGTLDLIKRCLLNIWNDGHIMGFISKEKEKTLLHDKPSGTFLLRFSETCKDGGITITWVEQSHIGEPQTHSVKPYRKSDLVNLSFPDVIRNYTLMDGENIPETPLLFLYPDIRKDTAFGRYYSRSTDAAEDMDVDGLLAPDPYIPRRIIPVSENPERRLQDRILPLSPEEFVELQDINKNNGMGNLCESLPQ